MSPRRAAAVIAAVVLAVGVIAAFWPTHVAGGDVGCGTALSPQRGTAAAQEFVDDLDTALGLAPDSADYTALCDDRIGTQRLVAFPVAGVGALGGLFLFMTGQHKTRSDSAPVATDETDRTASS